MKYIFENMYLESLKKRKEFLTLSQDYYQVIVIVIRKCVRLILSETKKQ